MKISYIINTNAGDMLADGKNPHRSVRYAERRRLLEDKVIPAAISQDFDDVIISGVYESGPTYRYVPVAPRYRDRRDALWQREIGARYSNADIFVFSHDDHAIAPDFYERLMEMVASDRIDSWDLLIPKRIHGITGATLNNGFEDGPQKTSYMGGHCLVMKRWLWAEVGWLSCESEWWDTTMSRLWKEAGGRLVFSDTLIHVDVEAAAHES